MLTPEDLKPLVGAWVTITGERAMRWSRDEGSSEWKSFTTKGILGRQIVPQDDGQLFVTLSKHGQTCKVLTITEEWRPAKNAIRHVCNLCYIESEVAKAALGAHPSFGIQTKACSLCGKIAKYDRLLNRKLQGVAATDEWYWQFSDYDMLVEHVKGDEFAARLAAHNSEFHIYEATVTGCHKRQRRVWKLTLKSRSGKLLYAMSLTPPTQEEWGIWFDLPMLKDRFYQGHDMHARFIKWGDFS